MMTANTIPRQIENICDHYDSPELINRIKELYKEGKNIREIVGALNEEYRLHGVDLSITDKRVSKHLNRMFADGELEKRFCPARYMYKLWDIARYLERTQGDFSAYDMYRCCSAQYARAPSIKEILRFLQSDYFERCEIQDVTVAKYIRYKFRPSQKNIRSRHDPPDILARIKELYKRGYSGPAISRELRTLSETQVYNRIKWMVEHGELEPSHNMICSADRLWNAAEDIEHAQGNFSAYEIHDWCSARYNRVCSVNDVIKFLQGDYFERCEIQNTKTPKHIKYRFKRGQESKCAEAAK